METVAELPTEWKSSSGEMAMICLSWEKLELTVLPQKFLVLVRRWTKGSPVSQEFDEVMSSVPGIFVIPVVSLMCSLCLLVLLCWATG